MNSIKEGDDPVRTCIYVFTGTGTSLAVAKKMGDLLGSTEILLIPGAIKEAADNEIMNEARRVGFVFPNYFGSIPNIVSRFIHILNLEKADYIFSVVTGGKGTGYCLSSLEQELRKKGKSLDYGKSITGTSNYIVGWYYRMVCKTGGRLADVLQRQDEKVNRYAGNISVQKNEIERKQRLSYLVSRMLSPKGVIEDTRPWDKEFSTDENCTGCGTCEKVCQIRNIEIKDGRPDFHHNCQRCMACIQYCPHNAIGFKGKPLNKPRYFHPEYPAKEIIRIIDNKRGDL
jgi:ferredoxin